MWRGVMKVNQVFHYHPEKVQGGRTSLLLEPEEDGHAQVSAYVYIETTTPAKIKQVPFESVPQI